MKLSSLTSPLLLYVLLSLSSLPSTKASDTSTNTTVFDSDGHQIQTGTKYHILPVKYGNGGGLALASREGTCPFYVMQENLENSNGHPLRFLTTDKNPKAINLSTDLNIVFSAATICVQSTAWRLRGVNERMGRRYVMSGGIIGSPGSETVSNWFKIEKNGNDYKIVFCPSVCSSCKVVCGDVGVFFENGNRWLGLSDEPLMVKFRKA